MRAAVLRGGQGSPCECCGLCFICGVWQDRSRPRGGGGIELVLGGWVGYIQEKVTLGREKSRLAHGAQITG